MKSHPELKKSLLWLLAVGSGVGVSTIYLAQPLLQLLMTALNSSVESIGLIVTLTQLGYCLGILFLIPLGDIRNRKSLIVLKLAVLLMGLAILSFAQNILMFWIGSFLVGIFATVAQDFVPLAADLSPPETRGKTVGTVMSGLLIGILGSRVFSGFIAESLGWRSPFIAAAMIVAIILLVFQIIAPNFKPNARLTYLKTMHSTFALLGRHKELRMALFVHGLLGLSFSAFWSNIAFYLGGENFHLPTWQVGALGLAGIAGALAAPITGRLSDRRGPQLSILIGVCTVLVSFLSMWFFPKSLLVLIATTVVFDFGVQMSLISHQSLIYALDDSARSRLNAIFVSGMFVFFSLGSWIGSLIYAHAQWSGVLLLAVVCSIISLSVATREHLPAQKQDKNLK